LDLGFEPKILQISITLWCGEKCVERSAFSKAAHMMLHTTVKKKKGSWLSVSLYSIKEKAQFT